MSMTTFEREVLDGARVVLGNPKLRWKDILEWSTGNIKAQEGEIVVRVPDPGAYVVIKKEREGGVMSKAKAKPVKARRCNEKLRGARCMESLGHLRDQQAKPWYKPHIFRSSEMTGKSKETRREKPLVLPWTVAEGNPPPPVGDQRKLVVLTDKDGMSWIGIRYWNGQEGCWWISGASGGGQESAHVSHWMDLPEMPSVSPGAKGGK